MRVKKRPDICLWHWSLRHVQGVTLLRLLWKLRCHAGYSGADPIALQLAFRFRQSPFRNLTTIWLDRLSDTTFVLYYLW